MNSITYVQFSNFANTAASAGSSGFKRYISAALSLGGRTQQLAQLRTEQIQSKEKRSTEMATTMIYLLLLSTSLIWSTSAVNSVAVEFDMTDRQVVENEGACDVSLSKMGKLTQDLNVRVRALTIGQYERLTGNTFLEDVPRAEANDFDSSYEEIFTFEANGNFRQRKPVAVSVVNDKVNEASEEFLLFFDIPDLPSSVSITTQNGRNPVRCRIMNDDDIQIGFENTVYTVEEGASLESLVFITKFDGFSTEEDIDIQISAIPQSAQLGIDFTTPNGERQFDLSFISSQEKIGIPISILNNDVSETRNRNFYLQFSGSGVDRLVKKNIVAEIVIIDTTPPSPSPSPVPSPSPSPAPSSTVPSLPEPVATVVNPAESSLPVLTNLPQMTGGVGPMTTVIPRATDVPVDREDCEEEKDEDLGLAIGLTFLLTFLLTALCAAIIILFVVIADRRRREHREHQQLS